MRRHYMIGALSIALVAILGIEVTARELGAGDFPLYEKNSLVGYIPKENQSGTFYGPVKWYFNNMHMGTKENFTTESNGVLLIGDGIVFGGNTIPQNNRLGPLVSKETNCKIWPLSAGSWSLLNELAVLESNPDLLQLPTIIFVSNSADFGMPSVWRSNLTHPLSKPESVALYRAEKFLFSPSSKTSPPTIETVNAWRSRLQWFFSRYSGRVIWVFYPTRAETPKTAPIFDVLRREISGHAEIIEVARSPLWRHPSYYDSIHPTRTGYSQLSKIIGRQLGPC